MLVLSRKKGERIRIGDSVCVEVLGTRGGTVRLGITGPAEIPIHRDEVYRRIRREEHGLHNARQAAQTGSLA